MQGSQQSIGSSNDRGVAASDGAPRVVWVHDAGKCPDEVRAKAILSKSHARFAAMDAASFAGWLAQLKDGDEPAAVLITSEASAVATERAEALRSRKACERTRLYLACPDEIDESTSVKLDLEESVKTNELPLEIATDLLKAGVAAHRALGRNSLLPRNYLDASYNEIYDWFENTRWDWKDIELGGIKKELLTPAEIAILKESAVIEFGTLPGAHNFLREWGDEYSFSSWALSWGAEEARHSLLQSRYLRAIGIEVQAKHAMYKREPYPIGHNRAATLMMNIISEARAAEYYSGLSHLVQEPVLREIWRLLGRDESRHCRAFAFFCKELCDHDPANIAPSLEMAYVFCADRSGGIKHPAGHFYPHSTSTRGIRETEAFLRDKSAASTDRADRRVFEVVRQITGDASIHSAKDIRRKLRELGA